MDEQITTHIGGTLDAVIADREANDAAYAAAAAELVPSMAIANAVTLARMRNGMTQAELAVKLGTTGSAVSRLESGRHLPGLETLRHLSDVLGLRIGFVVEPHVGVRTSIAPVGEVGSTTIERRPRLAVVPDVDGWAIRDATALLRHEPTQARAVAFARSRLRELGGQVVTHRATGEIREVRTVRPYEGARTASG